MKVTVIQQDIVWKDVQRNIARIKKLIMAAERSDIYLLPEMCSTGFCMQPQGVAEEVEGTTVQAMKQLAVELDAAIAVPVIMSVKLKNLISLQFKRLANHSLLVKT